MYHCHFEDVEHVQMGMTGIVFVRPTAGRDAALGGVHQVRLQRRRRLDRVPPPLRDPAERDLEAELPRRRPGHPGERSRRTTTRSGSPSTAAATRRPSLPNDDPTLAGVPADHDAQPELRRRDDKSQPNSSLIQVNPGDRVAAAAGQPRLPAARDAAAGASRCTSSARTPRCCATAPSTPRTGRTPSTSGPARRATCCSTHRRTTRRGRPGIGRPRQLQRLLLQEPRLAQAVEQRRAPDPAE